MTATRYRVHQARTQSTTNLAKAYRRHGVQMEAPSYVERRLKDGRVVERSRPVAPGYVMVPADATVPPSKINEEAGKSLIYRQIGEIGADDLDRMKATPPDDRVPVRLKQGDRVMIKSLGLTGTIKHMGGKRAVVSLDHGVSFAGRSALSVDIGQLTRSDARQTHPGS